MAYTDTNSQMLGAKIPDSTLANPIRICLRRFLVTENTEKCPKYMVDIIKNCPVPRASIEIDSEKLYGLLLSDIYNPSYSIDQITSRDCSTTWDNVYNFLSSHQLYQRKDSKADSHLKDINQSRKTNGRKKYGSIPSTLSNRCIRSYCVKDNWELLRTTMQYRKMKKSVKWIPINNYISSATNKIWLCQDFILIQLHDDEAWWCLDYEQVMMICDTLLARCFTLLYTKINTNIDECVINPEIIINIYKYWDKEFDVYGNSIFNFIKSWESIIMGLLLKDHDPLGMSNDFLDNIILENESDTHSNNMVNGMISLVNSFNLNQYQLSELHGIFRHWGHPTVDEYKGCKKVRDIIKTRKLPNADTMYQSKCMFNRQFCMSFLSRHGRFPRLNLSGLKKTWPLYTVLSKGRTGFNIHSSDFPLSHWGKIVFLKEFDFDYSIDFTDKIDDKSISVYCHDLPSVYAPEILGYRPNKPTSNRRLILEVLRTREIDMEKICDLVIRREVPEDWKIILVSSKEREMKIEPRLFAMMVLEMRLYFVITEDNISNVIFPYFPQQSMTMSEIDLTKRLYQMSLNEYNDSNLSLFMSIDFKSWNIHWQYYSTKPIFSSLDELFGTPGLYTYSHMFFSTSIVSLSSRFEVPRTLIDHKNDWKDFIDDQDPILWKNHIGGLEGIRQKGWTLITIILLLIVEAKTGIKGYIIGQGDNQVLKLMLPIAGRHRPKDRTTFILSNQHYIRSIMDDYTNELIDIASKFGLVIKSEESWISSTFINYGKDIMSDGAYLSQVIKRVSRTMPDINDSYPTMTSKISALQTTGYASASKSYDPMPCQIICYFETLMMMLKESRIPIIGGMSASRVFHKWVSSKQGQSFMLHGNSNLFNIPMTNPIDYIYRGHPDPLSAYLTFISEFSETCNTCAGIYYYCINANYEVGEGDPSRLIDDPTDLNIKLPPSLSSIFKRKVTKKMMEITDNIALKEVFHANFETEDKELCRYLMMCNPCFPRVLHEIKRQTPSHARDYLISKFGSARTVFNMLTGRENQDLNRRIIRSEIALQEFWMRTEMHIHKMGVNYQLQNLPCPTNLAQVMRNHTWKNTTNNRHISGVTIPHPYHQFLCVTASGLEHSTCPDDTEFILYKSDKEFDRSLLLTRGPYQPFHGTKTVEKKSGNICQIPGYSRPKQAAQRLMQLHQWCVYPSKNFNKFFSNLIQSRTNIPISLLELTSGSVASGSQVHRLNDHITKRNVTYNLRPNLSTHLYLTTDSIGRFGRGSDNCNMHFSGAILMGIHYANQLCLSSNTNPKTNDIKESAYRNTIHLHYVGKCCEEHILDPKISNQEIPPEMGSYVMNPLIYSNIEKYPLSTIPKSPCFSMTGRTNIPRIALATLILSQILTSISKNTWTPIPDIKITLPKISVRILIDIGIRGFMKELAILLLLYFDLDWEYVVRLIYLFPARTWQSMASACLLPELITELFEISGCSHQAELYNSITGVSRMLNRGLTNEILKLRKPENWPISSRVFILVPGCGISRIFSMWANWIYSISRGQADIRDLVKNLDFEIDIGINLPRKESLDTLVNTVYLSKDLATPKYVLEISPLLLSENAPEVILGSAVTIKKRSKLEKTLAIRPYKCTAFLNTSMVHMLEMPDTLRDIKKLEDIVSKDKPISKEKLYADHAFHLVSNLSTSYLKILQILDYFNVDTSGSCVAIADGTGSIARLLFEKSKMPVYFNTLIDTSRLLPQRGFGYIPSEFLDNPNGVIGANLSALYGGDITNRQYLDQFMGIIPNDISIITCDAEKDTPFTHNEVYKICLSCLEICFKKRAKAFIFRMYLDSVSSCASIISQIHLIYKSIFVCVPIFSSNESNDFYLYCSKYDPVISNIEEASGVGTNLKTAAISGLVELQKTRCMEYPHMLYFKEWSLYLDYALFLGFSDNYIHHMERMTNYLYPANREVSPDDMLATMTQYLESYNKEQIRGLRNSSSGKYLDIQKKLLVHRDASIHNNIENILIPLINCRILKEMYKITDFKNAVYLFPKLVSIVEYIKDDGELIYTFNNSLSSMKRDHIRSMWALWGHKYQNELRNLYGFKAVESANN